MTCIKTYDYPWDQDIVGVLPGEHTRPGDFVRHVRDDGFGTLIAITDHETMVLWSVEPTFIAPERYNPLSIEEDIYIPVGCQGGRKCPGCQGARCPGRAPYVQPEEDVSWFRKQLNRVLGKKS